MKTFATQSVPTEQRVEEWERHNVRSLVGLRCRLLNDDFVARETNRALGPVEVAEVRATPHVVERGEAVIEASPCDSVLLYLTLAGESFFYHSDGVLVARPGQVVVCDSDRPFMRGFSRGLHELVLKVPQAVWRDAGAERLSGPALVGGADGVADASATVAALHSGLRRRLDAGTDTSALLDDLVGADHLVDLAAALATGGATAAVAERTQLDLAREYVTRNLRDPGLSASRIARGIGLSERQLSRVFAAAGESVPGHVAAQRVKLARRLLARPDLAHTVAQVSDLVGFGSYGGFVRAFRAQVGMTPTEARRVALLEAGLRRY